MRGKRGEEKGLPAQEHGRVFLLLSFSQNLFSNSFAYLKLI
jgi:hypothetical protein